MNYTKQASIAQTIFLSGLLLLTFELILLPGPNFMANLGTNLIFITLTILATIIGALWLRLIEAKYDIEEN